MAIMGSGARTLSDLGLAARAGLNPRLSGITIDSRAVKAGFLFGALPGSLMHGEEVTSPALL